MIALGTYMKAYKVGDIVDVKANGAVQKGVRFLHPSQSTRTNHPNSTKLHKKIKNEQHTDQTEPNRCPTKCTTARPVSSTT